MWLDYGKHFAHGGVLYSCPSLLVSQVTVIPHWNLAAEMPYYFGKSDGVKRCLCKFEEVRNSLQDINTYFCTTYFFHLGLLYARSFHLSFSVCSLLVFWICQFSSCLLPPKSTKSLNMVLIGVCFLKVTDSIIKNICLKGNSLLFVRFSSLGTYFWAKETPVWAFNNLFLLVSCHFFHTFLFRLWKLFVVKTFFRRCFLLSVYKRVFEFVKGRGVWIRGSLKYLLILRFS